MLYPRYRLLNSGDIILNSTNLNQGTRRLFSIGLVSPDLDDQSLGLGSYPQDCRSSRLSGEDEEGEKYKRFGVTLVSRYIFE